MIHGLLVADVPGWAFDQNERDMARYLPEFRWSHHYMAHGSLPARWDFDFAFVPFHPWLNRFGCVRKLGSLRSRWFHPDSPGYTAFDLGAVGQCCGFHVVTRANHDELGRLGATNVVYLTNPVDVQRFSEPTTARDKIACWTGNAQHQSGSGDVKGFYSIIIPAISDARVPIRVAEYNTCRLPPERMPDFFRTASVCLCASAYEGASNSVMEAMAAGLAVIATDVGNHREMQESQLEHFGDTGIAIVERTPLAFSRALQQLTPKRIRRMGEINREEISQRWSWAAWRDRYASFVRMAA